MNDHPLDRVRINGSASSSSPPSSPTTCTPSGWPRSRTPRRACWRAHPFASTPSAEPRRSRRASRANKRSSRWTGCSATAASTSGRVFGCWVPHIVGDRTEIVIALDWTDFDTDNQSTIVLSMITSHGRATPLLWKTVVKSELLGWRNEHEDVLLERFQKVLPEGLRVTVLAESGVRRPGALRVAQGPARPRLRGPLPRHREGHERGR